MTQERTPELLLDNQLRQQAEQLRREKARLEGVLAQRSQEVNRLESALVELAERESRRTAQDLHDNLCQQLLGAAFCAKSLANQSSPNSALCKELKELTGLINGAVQQTRAFTLGTDLLRGETGLPAALQTLVESSGRGIKISLECPYRLVFDSPEIALHLYRIAQEALINAVTHSAGSQVILRVTPTRNSVCLEVEDDGNGAAATIAASGRLGVRLMRMRASAIRATLTFEAAAKIGVRVKCVLPK